MTKEANAPDPMTPISSTLPPTPLTASGPTPSGPDVPSDPEAAAKQFESVLVRQFVEVMTKDLFDGEGEGMLTGQADLQRDTLTDALTEHLVEAGTLGVADLLLAQWERVGHVPASGPEADVTTAPEAEIAPLARPPRLTMTMEDALRQYAPR